MVSSSSTPCRQIASLSEIAWYLQDLATLPVLSLEAEQEVVQQIAADPLSQKARDARDLLVKAHLRHVVRLARCYAPFGVELPDLVQEGNLALVKAAQRFDPQYSQRFRAYALQKVNRSLYRMVATHLQERYLPESDCEAIHPLYAKTLKALAHDAIDEQALVLDLPEARFVSLQVLLEALDTDDDLSDEQFPAHALYSDEAANMLQLERERCIAACLQLLTSKERLILVHLYLLSVPHTYEEVAKTLHITREFVRQLEERAIRKLRYPQTASVLRSLL